VTVPAGNADGLEGAAVPEGELFSSAVVQPARQASAVSSARIPLRRVCADAA
jgi:hypothetical protein